MGRKTNAQRAEENKQEEARKKASCLKKYVNDGYHYYVKWIASSNNMEGYMNPGPALTKQEAIQKMERFCDENKMPMPDDWGTNGGHVSSYSLEVMFWNGTKWIPTGDKKVCPYYWSINKGTK